MIENQSAELEIYGSNFNFYWTRIIAIPFLLFWVLFLFDFLGLWRFTRYFSIFGGTIDLFLTPILLSIPFYIMMYKKVQQKKPIISLYSDTLSYKLDKPMFKFIKLFNELFIKPKFQTVKYEDIDKVYKYNGVVGRGYYIKAKYDKFNNRTSIHTINNDIEMDMLRRKLKEKNVKVVF